MTAEEIVIQRLLGDSTISALVTNRVFAGVIPQSVDIFPVLLITLQSQKPERGQGGICIEEVIINVGVFAASYSKMSELVGLVKASLEGYNGNFSGVELLSCHYENIGMDDMMNDGKSFLRVLDFKLIIS